MANLSNRSSGAIQSRPRTEDDGQGEAQAIATAEAQTAVPRVAGPTDDDARLKLFIQSQRKIYGPRFVVFGSPGIGKQCWIIRLLYGVYSKDYDPTGSTHQNRNLFLFDQMIDLEFTALSVDVNSSPTYEYLSTSDHKYIIFAYNLGDRKSFNDMRIMFEQTLGTPKGPTPCMGGIVVALARDLFDSFDDVCTEAGRSFARSKGLPFIETSAKTGHGCNASDLVWLVKNLLLQAANKSNGM